MKTCVTIAVDTYDASGRLVGSLLGARASSEHHDPHDVIQAVCDALPPTWRQMSYDDLVEHFSSVSWGTHEPWEQLSIF